MTRPRRFLARTAPLLLLLAGAGSCSFLANEFVMLDGAGPVAAPPAPPGGLDARR
ncbi:MAG: hypothetical protein ACON4Z_18005 [Planctomycetota bacterium]